MQKLILVIFIALFTISLKAQNQEKQIKQDSLYAIWQDKTQTDSTRSFAYRDYIFKGFMYSKPDSAFILAEDLVTFGLDNNYQAATARGYSLQGTSFILKGDYSEALNYLNKSGEILEEIGDKKSIAAHDGLIGVTMTYQGDYAGALKNYKKSLKSLKQIESPDMSKTLNNIGQIYWVQGDNLKAIDYYNQSLKIDEELGNEKDKVNAYFNLGTIYMEQGEYAEALNYFNQCLKIYKETDNQSSAATCLSAIGNIYTSKKEYLTALDYNNKALSISEQVGDQRVMAGILNDIGRLYVEQGDYLKALEYHNKSQLIHEQIGNKRGITHSLVSIGNIYLNQGNYPKALDYCKRGYDLAKTLGDVQKQKHCTSCLYKTYKAMGKTDKALENFELLTVADDNLNSQETSKKLQQMEFAKQVLADSIATVEKERLVEVAHVEEVRQKNQTRNILYAVSGLVLLIAGGIYSRLRYVRKSKAIIEKEKDRSENLLLNILPAEIAEELKIKGKADAQDFDMVSILFTDFKGFTQASEKLTAKELIEEINVCFKAFDYICESHGVEKIKTIGDAYMAAGGLPIPSEDSIKNTVLAALEMQAFISNRIIEKDKLNEMSFKMRLGIHTGPVVAGIVGVKKFQYDIWGDTVNTASRMESSGETGRVNISEDTYAALKDDSEFTFESRGKIEAKGKGEIEMYFVETKLQ